MRLWAFLALFLVSQASAGEWTGFRDATLGADISQLGGFRQAKDNLFARASDTEALAAFGLSGVLYEVSGAKIVGVIFFAKDEETATALRERLSQTYGASVQVNELLTAWTGEQTQIVGMAKDGIIGFKLQRRPLEPPTPAPDAEASNDNGLGDWMEEEARKDAEKARLEAEVAAREVEARAAAAQTREAVEQAMKDERAQKCGTAGGWHISTQVPGQHCRDLRTGFPVDCPPGPPRCLDAQGNEVPLSCC